MPYPFILLYGLGGGNGSYPPPRNVLVRLVLDQLNETANTSGGELRPGTGNSVAPTLSTSQTITGFLNDALNEFCRLCYPIEDTGTLAIAAHQQYARYRDFSGLSTKPGGSYFWAIRGLVWGTTPLEWVGRAELERYYPTWKSDPTGAAAGLPAGLPIYWYSIGEDSVGVWPVPSTPATLSADGFAIPGPMTVDTDILALPPDLDRIPVWRACQRYAQKNPQNEQLKERIGIWYQEWLQAVAPIHGRLFESDPTLAAAHFPSRLPAAGA